MINNLAERIAEVHFCTILWKSVSNQQELGRFFYFYGLITGYLGVQKLLSAFFNATCSFKFHRMTANIAATDAELYFSQVTFEAQKLLAAGINCAHQQDFERAIILFTQALQISSQFSSKQHPIALKSYYHRGCALCRQGQYGQAITDFTQVISVVILLGKNISTKAAERQLGAINLADTYVHRGNAYRHLGHYDLALGDLNQAVERSGGSAQSYGCRGLLRLDMGEFGEAIADFDQALAIHPTFAQGYLWRGFARLRSGNFEQSLADLTHAIDAIPTCAEAYNHRGVAHFYLHYFAESLADFDRAIRLEPTFAEAYNNRGNLHRLLGASASAMADYNRAIALDPSLAELYLNRAATADITTAQGLADSAADYAAIADLSTYATYDAAFYRHRADVRAAQGYFLEAIADYTAALAQVPTAYAYHQRGRAYQSMGKYQQALADFDQALALSPDYAAVYCDRAHLRFYNHQNHGALADADQALALATDTDTTRLKHNLKQLYVTRALAHFCLQAPTEGLANFDQLLMLLIAHSSSSQTSNASTSIDSSET